MAQIRGYSDGSGDWKNNKITNYEHMPIINRGYV